VSLRVTRYGWWRLVLVVLLPPFRGSWPVTAGVIAIGLIMLIRRHGAEPDGLNRRNWPRTRCCGLLLKKLSEWWSPQQVVLWLKRTYPDKQEMRVSHETIYLSLVVQGKGGLRGELPECLRTGRAYRRPKAKRAPSGKGKIVDPVMISERPAEIEDRAVPGHWEGDLLMGKRQTAIGTLVERHTRYVMLFPPPEGNTAEAVRNQLAATVQRLPDHLWQSVTWDQGKEMAQHAQFSTDTGVDVYFCDPEVALAAWNQREHQRTTPPILSQRHQHGNPHPSRPRQGCPFAQREASTDPRRDVTIRETRRSVAMTP